jgi:hypothetical protein
VADHQGETRHYAEQLDATRFSDLNEFMTREASRYGLQLVDPVHVQLAAVGERLPPTPPGGSNPFAIALWSLKMRWWAWRQDSNDGLVEADVQIFVLYQQGQEGAALDRSLGIRKGRIGVVNAFAQPAQASRNRVVIMHELMHVLGAVDKYDPANGQPVNPYGLAAPDQVPLYPQQRAEIMGGRIAVSPIHKEMPSSLAQCVVGSLTATESGW